jgi:hypothetical protein
VRLVVSFLLEYSKSLESALVGPRVFEAKTREFADGPKLCAFDGDVQTTESAYNSVSIEHGSANQGYNIVWLVVGSTVFEVEVEVKFDVRLR